MSIWAIKVAFIPRKTSPNGVMEYVVKTDHYGIAHETAKGRLLLAGIDVHHYSDVVMTEILILEANNDGQCNEEHF